MATRTPKLRPYRCNLCTAQLAEEELGFVCQHLAHGAMVTLVADARTREKPLPDAACTACDLAMAQNRKNAEALAGIHVVCKKCYARVRAHNIDAFTESDRAKGYVLAPRTHYDRVNPRAKPLAIGPIREGRELKLGFSPVPSTHPISLERMWVRVTCVLKGGVAHAKLANDPQLFKRRTLKAGDVVEFSARHVLEIESKPVLLEAPPKPSKAVAKKSVAKKAKTKPSKSVAKKAVAKKAKTKPARTKAKTKTARAKPRAARRTSKPAKKKSKRS